MQDLYVFYLKGCVISAMGITSDVYTLVSLGVIHVNVIASAVNCLCMLNPFCNSWKLFCINAVFFLLHLVQVLWCPLYIMLSTVDGRIVHVNRSCVPCRAPEKTKKIPTQSYFKKNPAPNHHSSTLSPQPVMQSEKTSLHHDKGGVHYDKLSPQKGRWGPEGAKGMDRRGIDGGISLPEVRGAEGKVKTSMLSY